MNLEADFKNTPGSNVCKEFLDSLPAIVYETDCEGRLTYCNKGALEATGYTREDIENGVRGLDLAAPEDRDLALAHMERALRGEPADGCEYRLVKKGGGYIYVLARCAAILKDGVPAGLRGVMLDIAGKGRFEEEYLETVKELAASRQLLERNQENYRALFDIAKGLIYTVDTELILRSANESLCRALGRSPCEILERPVDSFPELAVNGRQWSGIMAEMRDAPGHIEFETCIRLKDKKKRYYTVSLSPILDGEGNLTGMLGMNYDITKIKQNEEAARYLAHHDLLTSLPNRLMLEKHLDELAGLSEKSGLKFGVLFLDLDNFKKINDTLGYRTGDAVLAEAGRRMRSGAGKYDMVARIGGDEFAIVVSYMEKSVNIGRFAERLLKLFDRPFTVKGRSIYVSASIGISVYPDDGGSTGEIMQNVDTAMYKAKSNGRNNYQFFDNGMKEEITRKVNIENNLRSALANEEFTLNYQPLINTRNGKIRGFEALIRWDCPGTGNVPPSDFIPIAEECGLIVPIEEWVLKTACFKKKQWESQHGSKILISVNISAIHFRQEDFTDRVRGILAQTGLAPEYLELEITESILINSPDNIIKKLDELRKTGIRISLDDFGTGYSSLSYLRLLPLDTLKIDKTFIHCISSCSKDNHFVKSIVSLVQKYKLDIVAEGVETPEQLEYLAKCRCNYVQGYLLGRPVTECDTAVILSSGRIDMGKFTAS